MQMDAFPLYLVVTVVFEHVDDDSTIHRSFIFQYFLTGIVSKPNGTFVQRCMNLESA